MAFDPDLAAPLDDRIRLTWIFDDLEFSGLPKLFDQAVVKLSRTIPSAPGRDKYSPDLRQFPGGLCMEGNNHQTQHDPTSGSRRQTTRSLKTI